jgi:TolB-like protein/DNA-binding SARP family transcriptional activator/pimeloyl-ACP methyl ester carboxylesterase/Tfp pilus assembly protein PilF
VLSLRFLGEPKIERDGVALALPRSRKTRALLAYLAVTNRVHRREKLCELFWDLPDDPRGALRWSLSKIRNLVDEPAAPRILADRETVAFSTREAQVDALELARAIATGLQGLATRDLAALAEGFGGEFLEGLDLPDQHGFHTWLIAQREQARAQRIALLNALIDRLKSDPESALPHARALTEIDSYEEAYWARLVRLLAATGRRREAEEQCELAFRIMAENGIEPTGLLLKVKRNLVKTASEAALSVAIATAAAMVQPETPDEVQEPSRDDRLPQQNIGYCTTADGVRIAFATSGEGPPVIKTGNWLTHLEFDWKSPVWRHWMRELSRDHRLIRYDQRGNGLSDWETPELSFAGFVRDLEAVVEAARIKRFTLFGLSTGAPVAIAYAHRHPERVERLVLFGGYARGWSLRGSQEEIARRTAMRTLVEFGWGNDNPAFRQIFTSRYMPDATAEQMNWMNELQRVTTAPHIAATMVDVTGKIDVVSLLPEIAVPTLVMHCRDDFVVPFAEGKLLANAIPGARFVAFEGRNHVILETEPAWPQFVNEFRRFLDLDELPLDAIVTPSPVVRPAEEKAGEGAPSSAGAKPTMVVLPFRNMSATSEPDFFADGITEDLTTTLSRVLGLIVVARDSALAFKGSDMTAGDIARSLGVRYALHGSVRSMGRRVRVSAYVVDSQTGREVWSARYDEASADVFEVQDQITTQVVRALQIELLEGEQARIWHRSTDSIEAWSLLSRGLDLFKQQSLEDVHRARALFEEAAAIDPNYAAAFHWQAYTHWLDARFMWIEDTEGALERASALVERALAIDPDFSDAHALVGIIRVLRHDFDGAIAAARRAVSFNPNNAEATALLAFVLTFAGEPEEALAHITRALSFSPHPAAWFLETAGRAHCMLRHHDEAVQAFQASINRLPNYIMPRVGLAACHVELGELDKARQQTKEILRINPAFSVSRFTAISSYRRPEHQTRCCNALRAIGLPE